MVRDADSRNGNGIVCRLQSVWAYGLDLTWLWLSVCVLYAEYRLFAGRDKNRDDFAFIL